MSWWQILLVAYLVLTPFSEIFTIAWIMVMVQEWQHRKKQRGNRNGTRHSL